MNIEKLSIGNNISCVSVSGNCITGKIVRILNNTIIVSNGIETVVVRKKIYKIFLEYLSILVFEREVT